MAQVQIDLSPRRASLWPQNKDGKLVGKYAILEPLQGKYSEPLFSHLGGETNANIWEDMRDGPFHDFDTFDSYIKACAISQESSYWAVKDARTSDIVGHLSYFFSSPVDDVVEIGHIACSRSFQERAGLTEAWALLTDRAFAYGFRIVTWNARLYKNLEDQADPKFGHMFEGWARPGMIVKGRVYDTAVYFTTDTEWTAVQGDVDRWLASAEERR